MSSLRMHHTAKLAIGSFYLFAALNAAFAGQGGDFQASSQLASLGMGSAATLWWIADATQRRTAVPYMSLWNGLYWFVTVPNHYLSTRGWRGLGKLGLHTFLASATMLASWRAAAWRASTHAPAPSAAEVALAQRYGVSPELIVRVQTLGTGLRPFEAEREVDPPSALVGLMFDVAGDAREAIATLSPWLGHGSYAFISRPASPFTGSAAAIAIVQAADSYEVMRKLRTNGDNYRLPTEAVIARVKEWDARYGVRVVGIGFDWLTVELVHLPADMLAFTQELYAFCPDLVDQGLFTVEELAPEIAERRVFTLWWD